MPSHPAHRDNKAEDGQLWNKTDRSGDNGGGWRQNDWKVKRRKQGIPLRVNLPRELDAASPTGPCTIRRYRDGGQSARMSFETG